MTRELPPSTVRDRPLGISLAVLACGTFVANLDGFLLSGLLPAVAADLGVGIGAAGLLAAAFSASYATSAPIIAAWPFGSDRRRLLIAASAVLAIGLIVQATTSSFGVATLGRVLAGIGAAGYQSTASAAAGFLAEPERRGRALAAVLLGGTLALVLGAPLGIAAGSWIGWRAATAALAALAVAVAALTPLIRRFELPRTSVRARLGVVLDRRFAAVLVMTSLIMIPGYLLLTYVAVVFTEAAQLTALAVLVFGLGQVCSNRMVGRATDSYGPLRVLSLGLGLSIVSLAALTLLHPWPAAMLIAYALAGGALGLLITPQQVRLFAIDASRATVAVGLNGSAIHIGAMTAAALGAFVIATSGAGWLVPTALLVAAFTSVLLWPLAPERWTTSAD